MFSLKNKRALVCGSSQGIGLACANLLAEQGCSITLLARNEDRLQNALQDLPIIEQSQKHDYLVADLSTLSSLKALLELQINKVNGYHILVNNTGGPSPGQIKDANLSAFEQAFGTHLLANHVLMQACLPFMQALKFGRIINIISTSVKIPLKGLGVSNTIRASVANWAKTLSVELAPMGITVNNVLPGATATQRLEAIIETKASKTNTDAKIITQEMLAEIPAARFATPNEIAAAVVFLASEEASYINGINLPVDGGRTGCL